MIFSSVTFLFAFLPIVLLLNFVVKGKAKNYVLLLASLVFYAWGEPIYIFLMLFSSFVNYLLAFGLQGKQEGKNGQDEHPKHVVNIFNKFNISAKTVMVIAVVFNIGLLGAFKYTGFFVETINGIFNIALPVPAITLPIGISFYTFQTLSYMIDVYRDDVKVQRSYANLLLYISFFPQLIAGPIVRYHDINEQIENRKESLAKVEYGFKRFTIGLAKKVLIANQMAFVVDSIYKMDAWSFSSSWIAALTYMLQIYFDFSGYSDMAIGLGSIFGFDFKENFNYPYMSQSIREFWRRWHISLSTWFKEYLYIPLGGSRVSQSRMIFNNFVVFFCTGLWHGASWNFVVWGLWQWVFIMGERFFFRMDKWWRPLRHVYTLLNVMMSFVIFRAETLSQAFSIFKYMFIPSMVGNSEATIQLQSLLTPLTIVMLFVAVFASQNWGKAIANKTPRPVKSFFYIVLWFVTISSLAASTYNPFIYFRF